MAKLTARQAAEAIEQFGDDLAALINALDRLCNQMPSGFTDIINAIPNQEHLDDIASAFRDRGDTLCRDCEAAEEAADWRRANPLEPRVPYPFCRTPAECAGKGYCPKEIACND